MVVVNGKLQNHKNSFTRNIPTCCSKDAKNFCNELIDDGATDGRSLLHSTPSQIHRDSRFQELLYILNITLCGTLSNSPKRIHSAAAVVAECNSASSKEFVFIRKTCAACASLDLWIFGYFDVPHSRFVAPNCILLGISRATIRFWHRILSLIPFCPPSAARQKTQYTVK